MYPKRYNLFMIEIRQTEAYFHWFDSLRDRQARARINARIRRLKRGREKGSRLLLTVVWP